MSESFVMYRSFHEALKELSREQYGNVMYAINEYALNGTKPEFSGIEKVLFMLMKPQIDANNKRKNNGRYGHLGGRPVKTSAPEDTANEPTECNDTQKTDAGQKAASDHTEIQKRFVKPTVEEIATYCAERKNGVEAQVFFDFYESKDWKVGNQRMKDWRACIRTWEQRRKNEVKQAGTIWGKENEIPENYYEMM